MYCTSMASSSKNNDHGVASQDLLHFTRGIAEAKCIVAMAACVSVCLSLATLPHYCMYPDVTCGNGRRCPVVVQYWADRSRCMGFINMTIDKYVCLLPICCVMGRGDGNLPRDDLNHLTSHLA